MPINQTIPIGVRTIGQSIVVGIIGVISIRVTGTTGGNWSSTPRRPSLILVGIIGVHVLVV